MKELYRIQKGRIRSSWRGYVDSKGKHQSRYKTICKINTFYAQDITDFRILAF